MIRAFFEDVVFPILLFLVLRSLLGNFLSRYRQPPVSRPPTAPTIQPAGELKKDPVCGTYVSAATSITRTVDGQVVHFCSKECSNRYGKG